MYYNYSEEQKYFLSVTDAMLKDDFSVEEIVEFWQSEDQDQVEGILGSLMLTESVDYSNPDLAVVCERLGLGWITKGASRLWKGLRGVNPKTGNPKISMGDGTAEAIKNTKKPGIIDKVKNWLGGKASKAKTTVKKAPSGVKVAAGTALATGAALIGMDAYDKMTSGDDKDTPKPAPRVLAQGAGEGGEGSDSKGKSEDDGKSKTPAKAGAWWKDYDKYDKSNYLHYRNIRKK